MFATLVSVALFALPAIRGVLADDFSVDSPSMTQCASTHFSWDATTGPYNVILVSSSDPCGDPLVDLGDHTSTSITWNVTLAAGTSAVISVADALGNEAWSSDITIGSSSDSSCLKDTAVSASSSAASSFTSSAIVTVVPTITAETPSTTVTATQSGSAVAAGAANAGDLPASNISGAVSTRVATSAVILSALAGAFALAL